MLKLNIYIVEDEPIVARILKQMVSYIGHHVCGSAASYDDAVADLQHIDTDFIITDIMLQGDKTGVDLARYINANLHIPFVFQSSVIDQSIIDEALETHPLLYTPKPLNTRLLANALATVQ